jgi:hypothetical protein
MKRVLLTAVSAAIICSASAQERSSFWKSIKNPATRGQLQTFVADKEAQANAAAKADGKGMPPEFENFFAAANRGDWLTVSNDFENMRDMRDGCSPRNPSWHGTPWEAEREIWGAYIAFAEGDEKYSELFGNEAIQSIPPGSIYFGGSDPGRFIITAFQKSEIKGEPFFTLTQNALADGTYLNYLRSMYGKKIYIPTAEDSQRCFNDFYADVKTRIENHQLKPGENVTINTNGKLQLCGTVAIMEINALIVKVIFDKETNREFYIEQSEPLEWMYPYLEPHGLILKLNHESLDELPDETVQKDRQYWTKLVSPMIGDWLHDDTPVKDVATFVEKVYLKHNFSGFKGDPEYVLNEYAYATFSMERSSIGDLYLWRADNYHNVTEWEPMIHEADFAFRQAWAMCPYSPGVIPHYVEVLMCENKPADALLVAETAAKFPYYESGDHRREIQDEIAWIKRNKKSK